MVYFSLAFSIGHKEQHDSNVSFDLSFSKKLFKDCCVFQPINTQLQKRLSQPKAVQSLLTIQADIFTS